jgi:hypothetical protein
VRGEGDKPLLHLRAENCNVTRRVLTIADQSAERMALAGFRPGAAQNFGSSGCDSRRAFGYPRTESGGKL